MRDLGAVLTAPTSELGTMSRDERICAKYNSSQARFILATLTRSELDAIDTTEGMGDEDYFFVALANTIANKKPKLAARFDKCERKDLHHYAEAQLAWLKTEQYLIGTKLKHPPSPHELAQDFFANGNGPRHRIWYCLKFPDKVEIIK
jgi:hypothetical protein